jgi:hypothetical protein
MAICHFSARAVQRSKDRTWCRSRVAVRDAALRRDVRPDAAAGWAANSELKNGTLARIKAPFRGCDPCEGRNDEEHRNGCCPGPGPQAPSMHPRSFKRSS